MITVSCRYIPYVGLYIIHTGRYGCWICSRHVFRSQRGRVTAESEMMMETKKSENNASKREKKGEI